MVYEIWGYNKALLADRDGSDRWLEGELVFASKDFAEAMAVFANSPNQLAYDSLILFRGRERVHEFLK